MSSELPIGDVLPSVDALLRRPLMVAAEIEFGRASLLAAVRSALTQLRLAFTDNTSSAIPASRELAALQVEHTALVWLTRRATPSLRRVFNLTGTVLHTNLGRSPLADIALQAMCDAAGACNVEYDLQSGSRGERDDHVAETLRELTGAEDALVVNNNAAAVLLALNSLANRREVIVSRGELIEIGGSFRLPDVMARAGSKLVEVGTTNRTHLADYENAISTRTAVLMKVHPSNYAVSGYVSAVSESEVGALARRHKLPFIVDLGSGTLADLRQFGLPPEPTPQQVIAQGADLVTFSGDKLLGGPQAGLIVGRADLIRRLKRNPLKRALRLDKLIIAALAATLRLYDDPDRLVERLPSLRLLTRDDKAIHEVGMRLLGRFSEALGAVAHVSCEPCSSQIGSGSLPVDRLQSWALLLRPAGPRRGKESRLNSLVRGLRALPIPIIGRLQDGALLLDLRCLEDEDAFVKQLDRLVIGPL